MKMPKYIIEATRTHWYSVEVDAVDELSAYAELDDWISDDFEPFETNAQWEFNATTKENENG